MTGMVFSKYPPYPKSTKFLQILQHVVDSLQQQLAKPKPK